MPLIETKGNQILSRPLAAIRIIEVTHFNLKGEIWTKGIYKVVAVYDINNPKIHFEGFLLVKK